MIIFSSAPRDVKLDLFSSAPREVTLDDTISLKTSNEMIDVSEG